MILTEVRQNGSSLKDLKSLGDILVFFFAVVVVFVLVIQFDFVPRRN